MRDIQDSYILLGVPLSASVEQIKKAYVTLIKKYHPDVCKEKDATKKFINVKKAYELVKHAPLLRQAQQVPNYQDILNVEIDEMINNLKKRAGTVSNAYGTYTDSTDLGSLYRVKVHFGK